MACDYLRHMQKLSALLMTGLISACLITAQTMPPGLRLWLRADTLTADSAGVVNRWGSIVGGHIAVAQQGAGLTPGTINARPAIVFANAGYYSAPSVFPVRRDYTMYVVYNWNGVHAANNMVSGQNRAFFTSAPGVPTVLHQGDFGRLSTSSAALSGPTVLRVRHKDLTGQTSISLNNRKTSDDNIPTNTDSVIFVGAYQGGYGLNGAIGEILIFERSLTAVEELSVERYLHDRYAIERVPDPPTPMIRFITVPGSLRVIHWRDLISVRGVVISDSVDEALIEIRRDGDTVATRRYVRPMSGDTVFCTTTRATAPPQERVSFSATVTVRRTGRTSFDTMYSATDITPGIAFSVNGQSNSIFGDASASPSVWARTFGGNFSQSLSDTAFALSSAAGNGGGPNVGAWALYLQNALAEQGISSLCISGGVGGTRIEQHLPDPNNRLNLSTIYGSWLYRVIKSGMRNRIEYLFWYQGESNTSADDYISVFDQLRAAWKLDLPALEKIIVIQIRPGCAGPNHAKLRDDQRKLALLYNDVIVHAASGLPGHDGCHYNGQGYAELGRQMVEVFDDLKYNSNTDRPWSHSPRPLLARNTGDGTVVIDFRGQKNGLRMTSDFVRDGKVRRAADAWFADNDPRLRPTSVRVENLSWPVLNQYAGRVTLTFSKPVMSVSYVPDYAYDDGAIFQGPWLVTDDGVGALSFHNFPVETVSVADDIEHELDDDGEATVYDLAGRLVARSSAEFAQLPSGPYIRTDQSGRRSMYLIR